MNNDCKWDCHTWDGDFCPWEGIINIPLVPSSLRLGFWRITNNDCKWDYHTLDGIYTKNSPSGKTGLQAYGSGLPLKQ